MLGRPKRARSLAQELDELGLWSDLPDDVRAARHQAVAVGGWPFDGLESREFFVDGESAAEYGVETLLAELEDQLRARGVALSVQHVQGDPSSDDPYKVTINGTEVQVWDSDDEMMWFTAVVRPLAVLNRLLAEAGSSERIVTLYTGGNEGIGYFLPEGAAEAIHRSGLLPERELPLIITPEMAGP